jgi:hypothetical protein
MPRAFIGWRAVPVGCDDHEVNTPGQPAWSLAVGEADWIRASLAPFNAYQVTSMVPGGFAGYARLLHPAEEPRWGSRLVRWAEVAAWSGRPLRDDAQFHSIALPPDRPDRAAPWSSQGPRIGSLYPPDAEVLAGILRDWTATPEQCWFCLWDGWGWEGMVAPSSEGEAARTPSNPIPAAVWQGPRVRLPNRNYLLYAGPVEAVTAAGPLSGDGQTANLWWPADRAWCVASEIDLHWTYLAGPAGLVSALLADSRLEALPARPDDPLTRVEDWVSGWAGRAADRLLAAGEATVTTSRGTVRARLARPGPGRAGSLSTQSEGDNGVNGTSSTRLRAGTEAGLREEIRRPLIWAILDLVGG